MTRAEKDLLDTLAKHMEKYGPIIQEQETNNKTIEEKSDKEVK